MTDPILFSAASVPPRTALPANTVDVHHHIYDSAFPTYPGLPVRRDASLADHARLREMLGVARNVLVQPSAYGFDNRLHLAASAAGGANSRAVVVVAPDTSLDDLRAMAAQGAVGARANLVQGVPLSPTDVAPLGAKLADMGWHLQIFATPDLIAEMAPVLRALPCPVVFDHLALLPPEGFGSHPAWKIVAGLLEAGRGWVKLSSPYALPPGDPAALIAALVACNPEQTVWGTNWPHPNNPALTPPDDSALIDMFAAAIPAAHHEAVFAGNAARLYKF